MRRSYTFNIISRAILAIMMMASVNVWAQEAKIGETEYATLQDAITAAEADATIVLTADVSVDQTLLITKNITIDGTKEGEGGRSYTITSNVTNKLGAFYVNALTCNFTIRNATVTGGENATMAVCAYRGPADIGQGTVSSVVPNGNSGNIITLEGCTVQNFKGWTGSYIGAVYGFSQSTVNLTGCSFSNNETSQSNAANSASGADVWVGAAGKLNINGGSLQEAFANSNSTDNVTVSISGGATVAELSICVSYKEDGSTYIPAITINDATVTDLKTEVASTPIPAQGITCTGTGLITNKPATEVAKILNGTATTAFSSVDAAITAATADQIITLVADLKADLEITTDKSVTLSLGTHLASHNLTFKGTGTLNIADGTITGNVTNSGTGVLTIAGGTISGTVAATSGTVNITGGAITGAITNAGTLAISDGTISGNIANTGALYISGGAIEGTITKTEGSISITGGTFTKEPEAGWIASGYEVMIGNIKYVVAKEGTAGAQIGEVKYQTIADAITAVSVEADEATTIVVLTNIDTAFEIPAERKVALSVTTYTISGNITNHGTLKISDGVFVGSITSDGTLDITGGTFTIKPNSYTCENGKDLIINAKGKYEVTDISSAEAQIGEDMYLTIGDAITAAGIVETTITLLKDLEGDNRSITIPATANITLTIADGVTLTKPISVDGTLAITSGTILESTAITITNFNAKVKITSGVTHPAVALSTALQTDNVLKSKGEGEPLVTTYWAKKKFEATVALTGTPTSDQTTAATALAANTSIKEVTGIAANQSLTISVTSVTLGTNSKVTKATFEVKLIGADGEKVTEPVDPAVTFRLPIHSSITGTPWVNLWHNTTPIVGTSTIQGTDNDKFITLTSTTFSPFSYEIIEKPIAQIGETKYASVEKAITSVTEFLENATEISLVGTETDVNENINVGTNKNVKLTFGAHTISGDISNVGILTISDGTISGTDKTITNTGVLKISGGTISNPVSATAGTLTISGGTFNAAITTSNDAGLTISNGTINDALSVGGTGTNTISGGAFADALTLTGGALTISAGTFNKAGDNAIQATNGTINITGGTFNNTTANAITPTSGSIHISGGTFTTAPVSTLCVAGYLPLKNDASKFDIKNRWVIVDDTKLSDNPHLANGNYTVQTAEYQRHTGMISAGNKETKYGTICLPFEINTAPSGMTLYKATIINVTPSTNSGTLTITEVRYPVTAGTPLIFELTASASTMTVTSTNDAGIAVNTIAPGTNPVTGNLLVGTYIQQNITSGLPGNIYYLNGDTFHQAVQSLNVPAFRAYMDTTPVQDARVRAFSIVKEGEESTGISAVEALEMVTGVYDLNGRKQSGLQHGINIMRRADGSTIKVIVK